MIYLVIGLSMFFSMIFTTGLDLFPVVGDAGWNLVVHKGYPLLIGLAIKLLLELVAPLIFTVVFIQITKLKTRLPRPVPAKWLFITGITLTLIPFMLDLLSIPIPDWETTTYTTLIATGVILGKLLIIIGAIKVFMAVKPSEKYVYPKN